MSTCFFNFQKQVGWHLQQTVQAGSANDFAETSNDICMYTGTQWSVKIINASIDKDDVI